jgi:hypothetical protein
VSWEEGKSLAHDIVPPVWHGVVYCKVPRIVTNMDTNRQSIESGLRDETRRNCDGCVMIERSFAVAGKIAWYMIT